MTAVFICAFGTCGHAVVVASLEAFEDAFDDHLAYAHPDDWRELHAA